MEEAAEKCNDPDPTIPLCDKTTYPPPPKLRSRKLARPSYEKLVLCSIHHPIKTAMVPTLVENSKF